MHLAVANILQSHPSSGSKSNRRDRPIDDRRGGILTNSTTLEIPLRFNYFAAFGEEKIVQLVVAIRGHLGLANAEVSEIFQPQQWLD